MVTSYMNNNNNNMTIIIDNKYYEHELIVNVSGPALGRGARRSAPWLRTNGT